MREKALAMLKAVDEMSTIAMQNLTDEELRHFNNMLHHWEVWTTDELRRRNVARIEKITFER